MRKIVLVIAMIAVFVGSGAAIALANEGNSDLKRQPSPEAVVAEHLDALNHCNVDRLWGDWQRLHPAETAYLPADGATPGHNLGDNMIFNAAPPAPCSSRV